MRRLWHDRRGVTVVEYGLIACLVVLAIVGSLQYFAAQTTALWTTVANAMANAVNK